MDMLVLITALSTILWYLIDRFKPLWEAVSYGKYITTAIAAIGGFGLAFGFNLDILMALTLVPQVTTLGVILTGFSLMAGSSAVSEIIGKIKGDKLPQEKNEEEA